jgi:Transposase DDE domain
VGAARDLGKAVPATCWKRAIGRHADDRFYSRQSTPLGIGRKKGEQKQAVGRSRGGRNTKIHALADAEGRLIAILLTGGEAHDCPVAERLIDRVEPAERMLGDKAYDSNELRDELNSEEPSQSFPTASIGSSRASPLANVSTSSVGASMTNWRGTTWPLSVSLRLLYGGFNESEP